MRHDIDRMPMSALGTARIEAQCGIRATYYFRMNSRVFRPWIMREIEGMGHEVGYHYEALGKAKGDFGMAICLFGNELKEFKVFRDHRRVISGVIRRKASIRTSTGWPGACFLLGG
ncbi:Uncharacterised protein [uncultured archaeon]|nr:Uncharacterised protein [uncultured archaeon]